MKTIALVGAVILTRGLLCMGQEPSVYFLLIDTSASMAEVPKKPKVPEDWKVSKLAEVKRQLTNFCATLPAEAALRSFVFDENVREGPQSDALDPQQREKLQAYVGELKAVGRQTHAWRSLDYALEKARQAAAARAPGSTVKVLLFTDGEDTDPSRPNLSSILSKYASELRGRVEATYVTLGFTLSSELVAALQSKNVAVQPALEPAEIIPLSAGFSWVPLRPTAREDEVEFIEQTRRQDVTNFFLAFGDGATSNKKSPKHIFSTPGEKPVQLTVTDRSGRANSVTKTIVISARISLEARFRNTPTNDVQIGRASCRERV